MLGIPILSQRFSFQRATSQGYFPKRQHPKSIGASVFGPPSLFQLQRLVPQPVLVAVPGPQLIPAEAPCPHCSLHCLRRPNLTFIKLPLGKLSLGKLPVEDTPFGKMSSTIFYASHKLRKTSNVYYCIYLCHVCYHQLRASLYSGQHSSKQHFIFQGLSINKIWVLNFTTKQLQQIQSKE